MRRQTWSKGQWSLKRWEVIRDFKVKNSLFIDIVGDFGKKGQKLFKITLLWNSEVTENYETHQRIYWWLLFPCHRHFSFTEKTIFPFPFTSNETWSWWQFSFRFWTRWNSIWFEIDTRAPSFCPTCFRPTFFVQSISSNPGRLALG